MHHSIENLGTTMKWLLILCLLISFTISILQAESQLSAEINCDEIIINQFRLEQACRSLVSNDTELSIKELENVLINYSGDNTTVLVMVEKYCPIFNHFLQCTRIGDDIDEECQFPFYTELNQQRFNLYEALLNYVCANRGAALLRILINSGFDTIYESEHFQECLTSIYGIPKIDEKTLGPSIELCYGLAEAVECYAEYVVEHENSNLVAIANEVYVVLRQAINCTSTNEL